MLLGTEVDGTNDSAIFSEGKNGNRLGLVAREGEAAVGAEVHFLNLGDPLLDGSGNTAFFSQLQEGGSIDRGIFSEGNGIGPTLVARSGDAALGAGVNFSGFGDPVFNSSGLLAFTNMLRGAGVNNRNDLAILRGREKNAFALVAREGDAAPGTPTGVSFGGQFTFGDPVLNSRGQTAFLSRLVGAEIGNSFNRGLFLAGSNGGLELLVRVGDPAPDTGTGITFGSVSNPAINDNGLTAFQARLTGTGVDGTNQYAIYSEGGGNGLALVTRTGDQAPGTNTGVNFRFLNSPVINGSGQAAFRASLTGVGSGSLSKSGIFKENPDGILVKVARDGDIAPGTNAGITFGGRAAFGDPVLNSKGQTAFMGFLNGGRGIFAEDAKGMLQLIARTGQLLDVSDDPLTPDFRTVNDLKFFTGSGNEDGRRSGFNNLGQLAFFASFTDGSSGIFLSNLVAIPEPATVIMLVMGTVFILVHPRMSKS
ncbi:MAG: hypothetical protein GXP24_12715 [Planctomycetes bacterium]|nr:hypothetical protein [Planctomycetota bacterium]